MEVDELKAALLKLMEKWDARRALWIETYKTDEDFAKWYSEQVEKLGEESWDDHTLTT